MLFSCASRQRSYWLLDWRPGCLPFYHQRIWTETKSDETARPKIATGGSIEGALLASLVANANWTCLISVASVIKKANSLLK
jgi:hypothetical protein